MHGSSNPCLVLSETNLRKFTIALSNMHVHARVHTHMHTYMYISINTSKCTYRLNLSAETRDASEGRQYMFCMKCTLIKVRREINQKPKPPQQQEIERIYFYFFSPILSGRKNISDTYDM